MGSEDEFDLLIDFPLHLKTEPLDDLFNTESKPILNKKLFESPAPFFGHDGEKTKTNPKTPASLSSSEGEQTKISPKIPAPSLTYDGEPITCSPKRNTESKPAGVEIRSGFSSPLPSRSDSTKSAVVTTADDNALIGGPPVNMKASKLHPYEDFHSFLIREGGIERERLARLVSSQEYPRPDEDFVSFLARSIGIKDEQYVTSLRQALRCEPIIEFAQQQVPVKMEVDQTKLEILPDEDAVSFFVRAGSWESTSSVDEEFASVGLDEDEDAESFLRRTGNLSAPFEIESFEDPELVPSGMSSFIIAKEELEALKEQVLVQISSPSEPVEEIVLVNVSPSTSEDMEGVVVNRKRRLSELE